MINPVGAKSALCRAWTPVVTDVLSGRSLIAVSGYSPSGVFRGIDNGSVMLKPALTQGRTLAMYASDGIGVPLPVMISAES